MYVLGPNNGETAEHISECFNRILKKSADKPVFILGDFNTLSLSDTLPNLQQYIDCPTCFTRTLHLCYGNIEDAYRAICRAPIGRSAHNVIHLPPKYRQCFRSEKPVEKKIQVWNKDKEDMLKDCFCTTKLDVFFDSCRYLHDSYASVSTILATEGIYSDHNHGCLHSPSSQNTDQNCTGI